MGDSLRYMDWFEKASQDLRGAEILMAHEGGNDLVVKVLTPVIFFL